MTKNNTHETNYGRILIGAIIIVGLVLIIFKSQQRPPPVPSVPLPTNQEKARSGSLSLRKQNDRSIATVGETFDIVLTANSQKTPIVGYDAVVNFDSSVVSYKSFKSVDERFEVIGTNQKGQVIITGTSKKEKDSEVMKKTSLVILTFTAEKLGNGNISLEIDNNPSRRDSNLLDVKGNDVLSKVETGKVMVGKKIVLGTKEVADGQTKLKITSVEIPGSGCADCITSVHLQVSKDPNTNRLDFATGGIDGRPFVSQTAFGVIYEIGDVSPSGVVVYYANQK